MTENNSSRFFWTPGITVDLESVKFEHIQLITFSGCWHYWPTDFVPFER